MRELFINHPGLGDVHFEDFGDTYGISGVLYENDGKFLLLLTPEAGIPQNIPTITKPLKEDWEKILRHSDLGTHVVMDPDNKGVVKAIYHKSRRQVEQHIIWEVYRRDNFTCCYCGRNDVPMTVDHYLPQALGGETTVDNLRTSCRKCNKRKGDMKPQDWENVK